MTTTHKKPQHGSLQWLELRHRIDGRCVFGASEIPALMDASEYESSMDLAIRKLQPPKINEPNEAMVRGTFLEPSLIAFAESRYGKIVVPDTMFQNGRIIATLDGIVKKDNIIVEAKTTTNWATIDPTFPEMWEWQAQAQMYATGLSMVLFVILDKYQRFHFHEILPNCLMVEQMLERADYIGDCVDAQRLPEGPLTTKQVNAAFQEASGEIELDAEGIYKFNVWQASIAALKDAENQEQTARDALVNLLRDKEIGTVGGVKVVSYKVQRGRTIIDTKAMEAEHPEIVQKYTRQGNTYRVLRQHHNKGE